MRIVVYNVRGFRDGRELVAAVLRRLEPDLVLMNETGARWRLRRLARALGMRVAADPWSPLRRRVKDAVLVRPPRRIAGRRLVRFAGSARWYPRGALVARVVGADDGLWAAATHLGLRPGERRGHAEALVALLGRLEGPIVVGGDLNDRPDGRAASLLAARFRDAWVLGGEVAGDTFPAEEPEARIDYLFVSEEVRVLRAMVPPTPDAREASDHRPVVVDVAIGGAAG